MTDHDAESLHLQKAALRGEPSYVWRAGQQRRMQMILDAAAGRERGRILENGCGLGTYLLRLAPNASQAVGLDVELQRTAQARQRADQVVCGVGEHLPFCPQYFDLILSNEVIEHVQDDRAAVAEIVRALRPGGRLVLFCPNRGYPFETHGIYWRGKYIFGNIPLVNYLPRPWRDRLAPHVRIYTPGDLQRLFDGLPVKIIRRTVIFGAYDNLIARFGPLGRLLRALLQWLEKTPLRF
ncbi:MAG: methyltransferase domain-containing protein, partial [Chloroflexi bacterium]|nr:methyltransferase domain-containing protein [Chloroflexota bacterium]